MPTFLVYINGEKKIRMEGANQIGLEKLIDSIYNIRNTDNNDLNNNNPNFIAPTYKSEDNRMKKKCCIIS
jgi:hypothetical protein